MLISHETFWITSSIFAIFLESNCLMLTYCIFFVGTVVFIVMIGLIRGHMRGTEDANHFAHVNMDSGRGWWSRRWHILNDGAGIKVENFFTPWSRGRSYTPLGTLRMRYTPWKSGRWRNTLCVVFGTTIEFRGVLKISKTLRVKFKPLLIK